MTQNPQPSIGSSPAEGAADATFELGGLLIPLFDAGQDEGAREIVELFFEHHTQVSAELFQALDEGDLDQGAAAAHSMIGSTGGIGARELADALVALEGACRAGDLDAVEDLLPLIKIMQERVLSSVRRFLAQEL